MIPFWGTKSGKVKEASKWKRPGAYFDRKIADTKVEFIESACRHVKGELAGQLIKLAPWEREIVRGIFGWIRLDGTRLFREVYIEVPKKNGKSTFGAALADTILLTDGEPGAEIYSVAAETEQANIIFGVAKDMIRQDPELAEVTEIFRRSIIYKTSSYHVLSADADTKEGKNSHAVLFDELHVQPNRSLYDNLKTGMASRRQPLMIMLTTAGFDRLSICWEKHQKAVGIMEGTVDDPTFLGIIFAADPEDDWTSVKTWKKANPNYGISVKESFIKELCEEAQRSPASENTFKRKHLNIWTEQETRWLQMSIWDKGNAIPFNPAALKGRRCYGGLDLSDSNDLTAFVLVFPPDRIAFKINPEVNGDSVDRIDYAALDAEPFYVLPFFWIPEENLRERVKRDHVPYYLWLNQGLITATPGNSIDHRYVALALGQARLDYDLRGVIFDPWGSRKITGDLVDDYGFTLDVDEGKRYQKPWLLIAPQTYQFWTPPLNDLVNFLQAGKIAHGGNPVLRWNASNAVVEEGKFGGIRLTKKKSREKIDGMAALGMGFEAAIWNANESTGSVYDSRDMRVL